MRNTITEIKNLLQVLNTKFRQTEERISNLEDRLINMIQSEEEILKNEEKWTDLRPEDMTEHATIHLKGILGKEERENNTEKKYLKK